MLVQDLKNVAIAVALREARVLESNDSTLIQPMKRCVQSIAIRDVRPASRLISVASQLGFHTALDFVRIEGLGIEYLQHCVRDISGRCEATSNFDRNLMENVWLHCFFGDVERSSDYWPPLSIDAEAEVLPVCQAPAASGWERSIRCLCEVAVDQYAVYKDACFV